MFRHSTIVWIFFFTARLATSQILPADFSRELVSGGITKLTAMVMAEDGRIFLTQQTGQVRIIKEGVLLATPFVSVTVDDAGERGLIGIALDPDFVSNGYVYVYYTMPGTPAHNRISRFTANGDLAVAGSEVIVLEIDPLGMATIHNGGAMVFGNDGKLYVGVGDNSNGPKAQDPETHLGKILRLNPDGSVPADNPNPGGSAHAARIWGMGVRNPFSFSLEKQTGRIFLIDVGANSYEEVNDVTIGGKNYGWPSAEGNSANPSFTNPIYAYPHGTGDGVGCAITGGTAFSPESTNYPASYYGKLFIMDFCEEWINTINPADDPVMASPFASDVAVRPLYLMTGIDGNLYYLSRVQSLYRIVYNGTSLPFFVSHPKDAATTEGESASFSVHVIGTKPMTYQWYRNGVVIPGATSSSFTIASVMPMEAGTYTATATNSAASVTSDPARLEVQVVTSLTGDPQVRSVIYPNPVTAGSKATLALLSNDSRLSRVTLHDAMGVTLWQQQPRLQVGPNQLDLQTEQLPSGLYVIAVEHGGDRHHMKLIIRH